MIYKARLVRHIHRDDEHGDLFLHHPDRELLLTYEMNRFDLKKLMDSHTQALYEGKDVSFGSPAKIEESCNSEGWVFPLYKKKPHRLFYLEHQGDIEGGRGFIEEIFLFSVILLVEEESYKVWLHCPEDFFD